ncbi:hypothetical protein CW304_24725 [Bacillus sp. UFRGS-B20]|nr:hypothetical protein CW304_24725 [Bacillus sp. UFRGS-B20]
MIRRSSLFVLPLRFEACSIPNNRIRISPEVTNLDKFQRNEKIEPNPITSQLMTYDHKDIIYIPNYLAKNSIFALPPLPNIRNYILKTF